jgi:transcriptional regulator with XRE-family HTH domain
MPRGWRQELGTQIAESRRKLGWTQGQLASKVGISRSSISYYEAGAIPVDFEKLISIARALRTRFVVRGYTLAPTDVETTGKPEPLPQQLCLALDKEHNFRATGVSIRPASEGTIVIKAIARSG